LGRLALGLGSPLLFFVALEGTLRLGGFGWSTDFFIRDEPAGMYRSNPRFTELFFPASFGLKPVNFRLSKTKPAGSFRVFVVGESAAMGVPEPAFSLAPQLQAQLRAAAPDRRIEVYNLGVTAINSHAVLRIVRQAVEFQPDLLVIYMGNNEVVGPYGPGSVVTGRMPPLWLIRLGLWVRSTRTGQLVQRAVAAVRPAGRGFRDWRGMEMFARNTVEAGDPRLTAVRANFAANLGDMLAAARQAGVRVVLSTVAVNVRDCAPFASQHRPDLAPGQLEAWQQDIDRASLAADLGKSDEARRWLQSALAIDPEYADTHYRMACALEASGDLPAARGQYLEALRLDALRFRADAGINAIVRRAAATYPGVVTLVDAARELGSDAGSAAPPAGAEFFFEHVHLRWEGNYTLARLLAPAAWAALHDGRTAAPVWLDPAACADAVGFTELGRLAMSRSMAELTNRPPFTGQSSYADNRLRLLTDIATTEAALASPGAVAAAVGKVDSALRRDPRNPTLLFQATVARLQSGDFAGGLALTDRLAAILPFSPEQAAQKAFLLQQLGRTSEAEELLRRSADSAPYYFQTYGLLAQLWISAGQTAKAREYFKRLVERMPDSRGARSFYAQLLAHDGDWRSAEQQWRAILRLVPDDASALDPLVKRLRQDGRVDEAIQLMQTAYAYNPRNFDNDARLIQVCADRGDPAGLVTYMQALAASGPVNARLYIDLAQNLQKLGRREEMQAALARGQRAAKAEGDETALRSIEEMIRQGGP
jgi:tetratricopeptide (TPR) repeat protein